MGERLAHGVSPFVERGEAGVAIRIPESAVPSNVPGEPAKLADDERALLAAARIGPHLEWAEVVVHAEIVAARLVVPAARGVDGPGGVELARQLRRRCGVELPPAFVEEHPGDDARVVAQALHGALACFEPLPLQGWVVPRKALLPLWRIVGLAGPRSAQ